MSQPDMNHPAVQSWNFVAQAMNDFAATLPPSASEAFKAAMIAHSRNIVPVLVAAATPAPAPEKRTRKRTPATPAPSEA